MTQINKSDFVSIVANIKNEIHTTQIRTMQQVNSNLIMMYFRIGKILAENSSYGTSFIENISTEIKLTYPNLKGFSGRNLRKMKLFYNEYKDSPIWPQLAAKLPWDHNILLIEKLKDKNARKVYMEAAIENGWSRSVLETQIKTNYHKRIGASTNNFKTTLPPTDSDMAERSFKDPYVFDFLTLRDGYKERELETSIMKRIRDILLELGNGWSFMGNQYKVTVGKEDYYIDLLFYHTKLRCYIVVELKATKFQPEFVGKMNFYLSAVDEQIKSKTDNPSIGLILCKEKDKITAQYALQQINRPIGVSLYRTTEILPNEIISQLPTEADLNLHIDLH